MCLGFDNYYEQARIAAEAARATKSLEDAAQRLKDSAMTDAKGHDVSCDGIQVGIWEMPSTRICVTARVPVKSESMAFFMLPAPRECLGDHMLSSPEIPCVQSLLEGWMTPERFVKVPKTILGPPPPTYRSMGGSSGPRGAPPYVPPPFTLPPAACLLNADGSTVFTLPTADVPPTTSVTDVVVRKAILTSLRDGMTNAKFDATRIFGPGAAADGRSGDDDADAAAKAETDFLDELYPNFRQGCDMLVCLPPQKADGKGAHAAFSFTFVYDLRDVVTLPLLGLVHNFDPSAADDKNRQTVEENYYVFTNSPRLTLNMGRDAATLTLHPVEAFLPKKLPEGYADRPKVYDEWLAHEEQWFWNFHLWVKDCAAFQKTCQDKVVTEVLGSAAKTLREALVPSPAHAAIAAQSDIRSPVLFSATNLVGRRVNDGVVSLKAHFFNVMDNDSAEAVKQRMKVAKRW